MEQTTINPVAPPQENPVNNPPGITPPPRSRKKIVLIVLALATLLLAGLGFLITQKEDMGQNNSSNTPIASPSPSSDSPTTQDNEIKMTLIKGETKIIPETDISITYVNPPHEDPNCFDCSTSTDIELKNASETKMLNFTCAGLSGNCINELVSHGVEIILEKSDENTASVIIRQHGS